jgi:Glycosyltransferase Family 4
VSGRLRIALLDHDYGGPAQPAGELALALTAAGHDAEVVTAGARNDRAAEDEVIVVRRRAVPDAPLRLRKIGDRPGRLAAAWLALRAGGYDLAHAFTAQDGAAAVLWARRAGRPVVFSCSEPLRRATLAHRRLRLALLRLAVEESDAVVAWDTEVAASLRRWMAVEPRVIEPRSAADHVALYEELLARAPPGAG